MKSRGFTILEVVLTLSMAVVLMSLVGVTLQFYARNMNVRDMDVRRIQLAASLLQMMADDLRAAVHSEPFDASTLEAFLASAAGGEVAQALDPAASEVLGLGGEEPLLEEPALEPEAMDLQNSMLTLRRPGMIGNQYEIQFDVSRLPRLEQWQQTLGDSPAEVADVPSDLKTVTYYVQAVGTVGGVSDPLQDYLPAESLAADSAAPGGLVRRELDRAANKWAMESGGISGILATGELLAAEIVAVEFSYFDGLQWQTFWNSDDRQALPVAIQVKLTLGDRPTGETAPESTEQAPAARVFTQIISLPAGRVVPLNTLSTEPLL